MQDPYNHGSMEVNRALLALTDALCEWERTTGRQSALILREEGGFHFRAMSGKPDGNKDWLSDQEFVARIMDSQGRS